MRDPFPNQVLFQEAQGLGIDGLEELPGFCLRLVGDFAFFQFPQQFLKLTFSRIVEEDLTFQLNLIKTSTFIIWGGKDKETPLKEGKEIHRAIKNSKLLFFPGAGHFSYLDDLPKFCSEIKKFIYAP